MQLVGGFLAPHGRGGPSLFFLPLEGKVGSAFRRGRTGGDQDQQPSSRAGSIPLRPRLLLRRRSESEGFAPSLMEGKRNRKSTPEATPGVAYGDAGGVAVQSSAPWKPFSYPSPSSSLD